ncbi:hypothetical protein GLOTRDRAFT_67648 [Gloeophyllum trabeum ATCC 11539]|uniref:Chromatin modification-related protein n=1 Tax=Gloeophyllum trabeum (strain ATCC 11539 / FP-39264 / Madison 617) TaxID=670483 RepID=S7S325_GLOTA|nr:uncharacterized protein GLOTRDRAFT_67648 [Gloeophyllum trabeum ATCC 11539]EPQ60224.1 hypothetical protein GLOTRDRAFT_67648 [Gloeophyllum trabeum ATCC 11539]
MAPRPSSTAASSNTQTAYSLTLLSEYTHTLDSLPIDLSRNFADLRELDAVLSSSMQSVTAKVERLTKMIEENTSPKEERLYLLAEIAEEASRLKPGSDDKIRVACHAADNLRFHANYLTDLLEPIPNFDATIMNRKTIYPHVATKSYGPINATEPGRRRRNAPANSLITATESPAAKKRRTAKDDELDGTKSPRKVESGAQRPRGGPRAKKNDRAGSPAESLLSVASHIPGHASHQAAQATSKSNGNHHQSAARSGNGANKRGRNNNNNHATRSPDDLYTYEAAASSSRRDIFNGPPSTSHPSLPQPYINGVGPEWAHGQLEGPGVPPVARSSQPPLAIAAATASVTAVSASGVSAKAGAAEIVTDGGEEAAEGDGDDGKTYCFCDRPSFGEMIACDNANCEKEWFHLQCIGMVTAPVGTWYCEVCQSQGYGKRAPRGGRRTGGKRAGNRASANA